MPIPLGVLAVAGAGGIAITGNGYWIAGFTSTGTTTHDKLAFATDTLSTTTGLSANRYSLAGMANSGTAGYYGGGVNTPAFVYTDAVEKFTFPDDTRSILGTGISDDREGLAAMANSGTAGYFGGGEDASQKSVVDKFAFSNDSRSILGTGLSANRAALAGMANSGTAGYFGGGYEGSTPVTTVDKFAFSNDGRTTLATGLSLARNLLAAFANSGTAGYFAGGRTDVGGTRSSVVNKYAFSNDSRTTLATGLSAARESPAGNANSGTAGYVGGGFEGSNVTTIDKFAFSDDTRSTLGTGLSVARRNLAAMANSGTL